MRGDKAAAGFQPPSSSHQHPLTLSRHVTSLSHGRFPSLRSKPDSVNGDFVYGSVLWRLLSLSPPSPLSFSLLRAAESTLVPLTRAYVNTPRLTSPYASVRKSDELRDYFLLFLFGLYLSSFSSIDLSGAHLVSDSA